MSDYLCIDCGRTRDLSTSEEFVIRVGCPRCGAVTTHQHVDKAVEMGVEE